jgi:peptidoglycan hydrolase CwlO-like protein
MSAIAIEMFNEFVTSKYPGFILIVAMIVLFLFVWNMNDRVDQNAHEVVQSRERMIKIEADVNVLKDDVRELKQDMKELKKDIAEMKTDIAVMKNDMIRVKEDLVEIKASLRILVNRKP